MTSVTARPNENTSQMARNLIRVVTGSYFMALSLDLVTGLDKAVLFAAFLAPRAADITGSTLLLCLSACFMLGHHLRLSALSLALFILASSLAQHMIHVEPGAVSAFWRDITLTCAIMLSYMTLTPHEMRRASILSPRNRRRTLVQKPVKPRRVTPTTNHKRPVQLEIRRALKTVETAPRQPRVAEDEREVLNIFANI